MPQVVPPAAPDLTLWQYWWGFNRDRYLPSRARLLRKGAEHEFGFCGTNWRGFHPCSPILVRERIAPELLRALRTSASPDIVTGCLVALAKLNHARDARLHVAEEIQRWLSSEDQEIQESAAIALGILGDERSIPLLTALLLDDRRHLRSQGVQPGMPVSERTRAFSAFALGLIGSHAGTVARQDIVAALASAYDSIPPTQATRDIPVACLTSIGLTPLPRPAEADLDAELGRPDRISDRVDSLRWLLERFDRPEAPQLDRAQIPAACARLSIDLPADAPLRRQVAQRLVAELERAPDGPVRQSCALALGVLGDCDGEPLDVEIRRVLAVLVRQRGDDPCKYFAMIALGQVAGRPGQVAGSELQGLDGEDSPRAILLQELRNGRGLDSEWAALGLALLERSLEDAGLPSSPESKGALGKALAKANAPAEVGALSIAVGIAKVTEAKDVLRETFEKVVDPEARGCAAIGLGWMDDRPSIARITGVVRKSKFQPELLKSAALGVALLGDGEIVPELVAMLSTAAGLSSQASICSALGTVGDARAVEPLIALLEDPSKTELARAFAAVALGMVADKDERPWNSRISIDANYRAVTPTLTDPGTGTGVLDRL